MEEFLHYFLPIYWILFFFIVIIWRPYVVWKRTGVNAFKALSRLGVHGVVVFYNTWIPLFSTSSMIAYVFFPRYYEYFAPFHWLEWSAVKLLGVICLVISLAWIWFSQAQMGNAWRLAPKDADIDHFVDTGLFAWTRNPIFLGIRLSFLGIFLVLPNGIMLALSVAGWMSLTIQVALEEEHLLEKYGEPYRDYCHRVKRWL